MTSRMTPMGAPPNRRMEEAEFVALADAHVAAQGRFVTEANALADEVQGNAELAVTKAAAAAASAAAALASEGAASASAAAAASAAGAEPFVANAVYGKGMVRWSPISGRVYRRREAGAAAADPSQDGANWVAVSAPWGAPVKVAADIVLQVGVRYHIDASAVRSLQMPPGAFVGDWLVTCDSKAKAGINNITLTGNGRPMPGGDATYVMDVSGETIVWVLDEEGWVRG